MTKPTKKTSFLARLKTAPALIAVAVLVLGGTSAGIVHASSIQQQINDLSAKNSQKQSTVDALQVRANNYQDAINKLQTEVNAIQRAIAGSEAKKAKLQAEIDADQKKLDQQKQYLGEDLKAMYVDGSMTTVEMLATSKNLSDFVDAETYRGAVQTKIQNTLKEIAVLQNELKDQQTQVEQLLELQKNQQARLDSDKAEQNRLLSLNQSEQASYNHQIASNNKKISELQAQQAAINARNSQAVFIPGASGGSGGACDIGSGNGGYPMSWCNAPQDTIPTIPYSSDPINRECTSFAYWYYTQIEGKSLYVTGNAKDWATSSYTPRAGAIGISSAGYYGHAMIILATGGHNWHGVSVPAGQVLTMSMNYDYQGHFHYDFRAANSLSYIY